MSLQGAVSRTGQSNRPIAVEFVLVTAIMVGLYLWHRTLTQALTGTFGLPPSFGGLLVSGLVTGGLFIAGLVLFTGTYVTVRDIEVGLALPSRSDLRLGGLAGLVPVLLVGLTKLVGTVTNVQYNSLTKTSVAANAPLTPVLLVAGLGILVSVPALVVVCQVLVQGSFKRVVGGANAVIVTTLLTGFVMVSNSGGLATAPDRGKLIGVVLFALPLGLALYANEFVDRDRLRYLAYGPVLLFGGLVVVSGIVEIESIAGGLFAATHLAVLGLAAFTYDRTESLVVPAIAYTSLLLANWVVVITLEAGMQSW